MVTWLERELEDYIVSNPRSLSVVNYFNGEGYEYRILGRQVACDAGIIDLLAWEYNENSSRLLLIECKAANESGKAVEQVIRYSRAIDDLSIHADIIDLDDTGEQFGRWAKYVHLNVVPVIIAPSFSERLTKAYKGHLIHATRTESGFVFNQACQFTEFASEQHLKKVLSPVIRRAYMDAMQRAIADDFAPIRRDIDFSLN